MAVTAWSEPGTLLGLPWSGGASGGTSPTPQQLGQTVEVTQDKFTDNVTGSAVPIVIGTAPVPGMIVLGSEVIVTTVYSGSVDPAENVGGSGGDQGGGGVSSGGGGGGGGDDGELDPPDGPMTVVIAGLTATYGTGSEACGGTAAPAPAGAQRSYMSSVTSQWSILKPAVGVIDGQTVGIVTDLHTMASHSALESMGSWSYCPWNEAHGWPSLEGDLKGTLNEPFFRTIADGTSARMQVWNIRTLSGSPVCGGFGVFLAAYKYVMKNDDDATFDCTEVDFGSITCTRIVDGSPRTQYVVESISVSDPLQDPDHPPMHQMYQGVITLHMVPV